MAKITVEEQVEYPTLPKDSILFLKVQDLEVKDVSGQHGSWQKLEFTFKILGVQQTGDGSPVGQFDSLVGEKIWGSVPFRLTDSSENKLRLWVEALLGMEIGVGFELDTDILKDRECRGITTQYEKRARDPKTGLPFKNHQVDSLLAKGGVAPASPGPAADPWQAAPAGVDPWAQPAQPAPQQQFAAASAQPAQGWNPTGQAPVNPQNAWDADEPPF